MDKRGTKIFNIIEKIGIQKWQWTRQVTKHIKNTERVYQTEQRRKSPAKMVRQDKEGRKFELVSSCAKQKPTYKFEGFLYPKYRKQLNRLELDSVRSK